MAISANKVAPSAVVLAFVGYCIWPSVAGMISEPPRPKPAEKLPPLAASLFTMTLSPPPTRNPWGGKDVETLAKIKKAKEAKIAEDISSKMNSDAKEVKPTIQPIDLLRSLTLDATCIGGGQRLAIINDRMYGLQELLRETDPGSPPCKIIDVSPYEVLLECQGKTLQLRYANSSPPFMLTDINGQTEEEAASNEAQVDSPQQKTGKKPAVKKSSTDRKKSSKAKTSKAGN
jgi:hypothetical protein